LRQGGGSKRIDFKGLYPKKRLYIGLTAVLLLSVFAVLTLASPDINIAVTAPDNVSICVNRTYTINITNTESEPIYNITLNVTMPDDFWYNVNTTTITFPGGASSEEPLTDGNNLSWNLSEIIGSNRHVVINEFEQNPPGTDAGNEWVELYNPTSSDVNIGGWRLINGDGDNYTIPTGTTISSKGFWTHTFTTQWLDQTNENVTLYNDSAIVDQTPTTDDTTNNDSCWARYPNGYDSDSDSDWVFQLSTKNETNGGTLGDLNPGDSIELSFNLTAGCNAENGKRLKATVKYDGKTSTGESDPITVYEGYLKLTKLPNVIEASKGEIVEWNISISNTGLGAIRNVTINESLGAGLELVNITSPNHGLNWSYDMINASETKSVTVRVRVIACENLENYVDGWWGCDGICQETYTKASVKIILKEPHLDYEISPSIISVPYCGNATVSINFTNSGEGNASDI
jgi:uncharacterized repeat protein (TIGR01451 family)